MSDETTGRRYHFLNPIGRGGFGTVYRSEARGEGGFVKPVAIKLLNADVVNTPDIVHRLRDEARVLGLVRHRAIVQVDGLTRLAGRWAVVMEFVDGVDLKLVMQSGPIPLGPALEIVREVAGALNAAYNAIGPEGNPLRLLHRDIKPSNIQITRAGEVKVLDFGIARADFAEREARTQSVVYGSVNYMAPERLDFEDGPNADIYSLGCVFAELLSGVSTVKTSANQKKHDKVVAQILANVRLHQTHAPSLDLLQRMLAYEPEDRPTAKELERATAKLRMSLDHCELLIDWSEDAVPRIAEKKSALPNDPLCGTTLSEQTSPSATSDETQWVSDPASQTTWMENSSATLPAANPGVDGETSSRMTVFAVGSVVTLLGFGAIVVMALIAVAIGIATLRSPPEEEPTPITVAPTPEPVEPTPTPEPTPPIEPVDPTPTDTDTPPNTPDEGVETSTSSDRRSSSRRRRRGTSSTPDPVTDETTATEEALRNVSEALKPAGTSTDETPKTYRVQLDGNATTVYLKASDNHQQYALPGDVPKGTYDLYASFDQRAPTRRMTIRVDTAPVQLTCVSAFGKCRQIK